MQPGSVKEKPSKVFVTGVDPYVKSKLAKQRR
jgi:hypothetical protein